MDSNEIPTHRNKKLGNGFINIPHVLILGAGASKASFPNGDLNGLTMPLMKDLVEVVGLNDLLKSSGIKYENENFEVIFSHIVNVAEKEELRKELEKEIFAYFSKMRMQDELTIYDKLILSLRDKDIIATFNWDPLLLYAYRRCGNYFNSFKIRLPEIVFLHGNVALGVCEKDKILSPMDSICPKCQKRFKQVQLLYPILKKDYTSNAVIKEQWDKLKYHISEAYFVTIFGYSAPATDTEAIKLMHDTLEINPRKELTEIEIIDTKEHDILLDNWRNFIVRHYRMSKSVNNSYLFQHPRRTIEAFFDCFLQNSPWPENPMLNCHTFEEMADWLAPLLNEEREITN